MPKPSFGSLSVRNWQAVTPSLGGNDSLPLYTNAMIHRYLIKFRRERKLEASVTRHASQQFWEVVPSVTRHSVTTVFGRVPLPKNRVEKRI